LLPLKDLNRSSTTPHVNRILLITNIIIFTVYFLSSLNIINQQIAYLMGGTEHTPGDFVMVPNDIIHGQRVFTLFTSMFMHASWLHLLGNMLFLYVFGDNVEDIFGHVGYIIFYLVAGLAAAFAYILSILYAPVVGGLIGIPMSSDLMVGVLGASGAISGVLGAYLVLYPKAKIIALVFYFILPVPAIIFLGGWFLLQWVFAFFDLSGGVAYFAHIGGFIAGMVLAFVFGLRRKKLREARLSVQRGY
jgi:membrane associated rhomboid family serine protease